MTCPSSTISLNSIVDAAIIDDIVGDIVTCGRALNRLRRQDIEWDWSAECDQAFSQLKEILAQKTRLVHYDPTKPITLEADASSYSIGAVISQSAPDGTEEPIAFASKTLTSTEKNYSQVEKALSIIFGVRKFHQYLKGHCIEFGVV